MLVSVREAVMGLPSPEAIREVFLEEVISEQ